MTLACSAILSFHDLDTPSKIHTNSQITCKGWRWQWLDLLCSLINLLAVQSKLLINALLIMYLTQSVFSSWGKKLFWLDSIYTSINVIVQILMQNNLQVWYSTGNCLFNVLLLCKQATKDMKFNACRGISQLDVERTWVCHTLSHCGLCKY